MEEKERLEKKALMEEKALIEKKLILPLQADLIQLVQKAQSLVTSSLAQFLQNIDQVDELLAQARKTAKIWNTSGAAVTLMLPETIHLSTTAREIKARLSNLVVTGGLHTRPLGLMGGEAKEITDNELAARYGWRVRLCQHVHKEGYPPCAEFITSEHEARRMIDAKTAERVEVVAPSQEP